MFMADAPDFVVVFLAALRIGAVPVPVSTMVRADALAGPAARLARAVPGRRRRSSPTLAAAARRPE